MSIESLFISLNRISNSYLQRWHFSQYVFNMVGLFLRKYDQFCSKTAGRCSRKSSQVWRTILNKYLCKLKKRNTEGSTESRSRAYHMFPERSQLYRLPGRWCGRHLTSRLMTTTTSPSGRTVLRYRSLEGRRLDGKRHGIFLGLQGPRICRSCHRWRQAAGHVPLRLVLREPLIVLHDPPRSWSRLSVAHWWRLLGRANRRGTDALTWKSHRKKWYFPFSASNDKRKFVSCLSGEFLVSTVAPGASRRRSVVNLSAISENCHEQKSSSGAWIKTLR